MIESKKDLLAILRDALPEWSEYRPSDIDDQVAMLKRGRRVTLPLMLDPPGLFSGRFFTDPSVQPAPVEVLRRDGLSEEETTVVYFSWDFTPNSPGVPVIPIVPVLIRWGVGGQTFTRMIDAHRVPRRLALAANFIQVIAAYVDPGNPTAGTTVDAIVGIATGAAADPNYWTSWWVPFAAPIAAANVTQQPAAIVSVAGTLTLLPAGTTNAYVLLIDSAVLPVSGVSVPISGGISPQLQAGSSFAFSEDEWPGVFAEFGVSWAVSTTPNLYIAPGGGTSAAEVQLKLGM